MRVEGGSQVSSHSMVTSPSSLTILLVFKVSRPLLQQLTRHRGLILEYAAQKTHRVVRQRRQKDAPLLPGKQQPLSSLDAELRNPGCNTGGLPPPAGVSDGSQIRGTGPGIPNPGPSGRRAQLRSRNTQEGFWVYRDLRVGVSGLPSSHLTLMHVSPPCTPDSPACAFAHCFYNGYRLHHFRKAGRLPLWFMRPNRVRLTLQPAHLHTRSLRDGSYPPPRTGC